MASETNNAAGQPPIQFVSWCEVSKKFGFVNEQAVADLFAGLPKPLKIVGVIGKLRSGKSFLMNCLYWHPESPYARGDQGFALGATTTPVTKGIWVWAKRLPAGEGSLVLLDTEGLFDPQHTDPSYDVKVFAMTIALCNTLVYNIQQYPDATVIDSLAAVSQLTKTFAFRKADKKVQVADAPKLFPRLEFLVRDFSLDLVDADKKAMSEHEWLEASLLAVNPDAELSDEDKTELRRNDTKQLIKKLFLHRNLATLPRPTGDDALLKHMERATEADVAPKFRERVQAFTDKVLSEVEPRRLLLPDGKASGTAMDGRAYLEWVRGVVASINDGKICVETAVAAAARAVNNRAFATAADAFKETLAKAQLPESENEFSAVRMAAFTAANAVLKAECLVVVVPAEVTSSEFNACPDEASLTALRATKHSEASAKEEERLAADFAEKHAEPLAAERERENVRLTTAHWKGIYDQAEREAERRANECMRPGGGDVFLQYCTDEFGLRKVVDDSADVLPVGPGTGRVPQLPAYGLESVRADLLDALVKRVRALGKTVIKADANISEQEAAKMQAQQEADEQQREREAAEARAELADAEAKAKASEFASTLKSMKENHAAALEQSQEQHEALVTQLRDEAEAARQRGDEDMKELLDAQHKREEASRTQMAAMMDKQMTMMRDAQAEQAKLQRESQAQLMDVMTKIANKPPPTINIPPSGGGGGCIVA